PRYSNQQREMFEFENINNQFHPQQQFGIPNNSNKPPTKHVPNENNHRFRAPFQDMNNPFPFGLGEDLREISHQRFRDISPTDAEYNQKTSTFMKGQSNSETNQEFQQNSSENINVTQKIHNFPKPTNYGFNPISIHPSSGPITPFLNSRPFLSGTVDEPEIQPFVSPSFDNNRGGRELFDPASAPFQNLPEFDLVGIFEGLEPSPYFDVPIGPPIPRLNEIPDTGFTCAGLVPGYYADTHEASQCQSFHFCGTNGRKISYLCPDGTMFNQQLLVCDHVGRVQCNASDQYYHVNKKSYEDHTTLYSRGGAFEDFGRRIYRY
ncbi:unnamed protein product, partial [Meganyctiphanes norvegica]